MLLLLLLPQQCGGLAVAACATLQYPTDAEDKKTHLLLHGSIRATAQVLNTCEVNDTTKFTDYQM
jgi:hypothetical protein